MTRLRTQVLAACMAGLAVTLAPLAASEDSLENLRQLVSKESWQESVIVGRELVEIEPTAERPGRLQGRLESKQIHS